jgi:hypothetical protein
MTLHREFKIISETALKSAINFVESNWRALLDVETPIFLIITSAEEKRRDQQNKYYWAVVIRSIAEQAWLNGKQFSAEAWHEYFASQYGVKKEIEMPNGCISTKRLSTTEMKVREFSEYTQKVEAYGAQELAVRFPAGDQYL